MIRPITLPLLAVLAATATPLAAQDNDDNLKTRYGLQASLAVPYGKQLKDIAGTNFGIAFFSEVPFNDKHAFRSTADFVKFGDTEFGYGITTGAYTIGVKGEWVYRMQSHNKGGYLFGGIGWYRAYADGVISWGYYNNSIQINANGFGISAGAGYNFNKHFGVEAKLVQSLWWEFKYEDASAKEDWGHFLLSATLRF